MFSDGHGGDIEICSCGSLGHFSDQSNIQVGLDTFRCQIKECVCSRQLAESTMSFNRKLNEDRKMRIPYIGKACFQIMSWWRKGFGYHDMRTVPNTENLNVISRRPDWRCTEALC